MLRIFFISMAVFLVACGSEDVTIKSRVIEHTSSKDSDHEGRKFQTVTFTKSLGESVTWMAQNLATTTYRNGEKIPLASNIQEWVSACNNKTPICAYWKFDQSYSKMGVYYNWFAVSDSLNQIAPEGYHVASGEDWNNLKEKLTSSTNSQVEGFMHVDGNTFDDLDMDYVKPDGDASRTKNYSLLKDEINSSGLEIKAYGQISSSHTINCYNCPDGLFQDKGKKAFFWTPDTGQDGRDPKRYPNRGSVSLGCCGTFSLYTSDPSRGYNVRCVKD